MLSYSPHLKILSGQSLQALWNRKPSHQSESQWYSQLLPQHWEEIQTMCKLLENKIMDLNIHCMESCSFQPCLTMKLKLKYNIVRWADCPSLNKSSPFKERLKRLILFGLKNAYIFELYYENLYVKLKSRTWAIRISSQVNISNPKESAVSVLYVELNLHCGLAVSWLNMNWT